LVFRVPFELDPGTCAGETSVTCLLGQFMAAVGADTAAIEEFLNSLTFEVMAKKEKWLNKISMPRFTLRMSKPIILYDSGDTLVAFEDPDGNGPSMYVASGTQHPSYEVIDDEEGIEFEEEISKDFTIDENGLPIVPVAWLMYGGRIPIHWRIGTETDIYVIGKMSIAWVAEVKDPSKNPPNSIQNLNPTFSVSAHVPSWITNVLYPIPLPVHIKDVQFMVVHQQNWLQIPKTGKRILQLAGTICLGTADNCRYKKCNYIEGSLFTYQDLSDPLSQMKAVMLSELTFGTILRVMCDSEWFGFCGNPVDKAGFMAALDG